MTASGVPSRQPSTATRSAVRHLTSATVSLIALNVLIFIVMAYTGHHLLKFDGGLVLRWGGNYGPLMLDGQWWRVITAMFVHIGLAHLLVNMWCLYELGFMSEEIYGASSMLWLYGLTGVAGGIVSVARHPTVVSAGASGAIFGLGGVLIATLALGKLPAPRRELLIALVSLLAFAAYNLAYGFVKGGVDNGAHLGGLVFGLLLGGALSRSAGQKQAIRARAGLVYGTAMLVLVAGYFVVGRARAETVAIEASRQALTQHDPNAALHRLSRLPATGRNPEAQSILAAAYVEKREYAEAEKCYRRALELDPNNFAARSGLGALLADGGRWQEAVQHLQKAAAINPTADGVWLRLGLALQKLSRHEEAVTALNTAAALNPSFAAADYALGISEMNLRRYDAAVAAFQKAAQLAPSDYGARIWLANAYQAAGRTQEAAATYFLAAKLRRQTMPRQSPAPNR